MSNASKKLASRPGSSAVAPAEPPSMSTEDYLERISELIARKGYARVVDIAELLEVSRPSVTAMVQRLADAGYLHYEKYRGLVLTEKGQSVGQRIRDRHATLKRLLSLLRLDEAIQENDIEGLEHSLSPATLERLTDLTEFLEEQRERLEAFFRRRKPQATSRE